MVAELVVFIPSREEGEPFETPIAEEAVRVVDCSGHHGGQCTMCG